MNKKMMLLSIGTALLAAVLIIGQEVWSLDPAPIENIEEAVKSAKTKADHEAIAKYFEQEAKDLQGKAEQHQRLAAQYGKSVVYGKLRNTMGQHCKAIARNFSKAAEDNLDLAKLHHQLAGKAQP